MISTSRPDLPALLAYLKRVEEARKLVAEFDEWLASAPPLPTVELPKQLTAGTSQIEWETTDDLAIRVVGILRHDGGPLRARDILTILQQTGTSFISDNPVYSVVGALKVARENGWVVKKGRGWWQAASRGAVGSGGAADGGESVAPTGAGDDQWSHQWGGE
ncbi:MAG: hypothetical protein F4Z31_22970 [Gemmatimonadetes bacterium]|nr:hypothetical protein [Gemmatimonadota bacterium]MYE92514.1 hypothetical protein [Gemmatimonadota bacterium]MYJ09637.1 hypothetical protein [Gemmatimonadota bacterium]